MPSLQERIALALSSDEITAWEESFLRSIFGYLKRTGTLSAKQLIVLMKIEDAINNGRPDDPSNSTPNEERAADEALQSVDDFMNSKPWN